VRLETEIQASKKVIASKNKLIHKKDLIIANLRKKISVMEAEMEAQRTNSNLLKAIHGMFTTKQIQCLLNRETFVHWTDLDIAKSISLESVSSKAYDYVRNTLRYPLPSRCTIQMWLSRIDVKPGIIRPVLYLLENSMKNASQMERVGTMAIDEMSIDDALCYDPREDRIKGGSDQMLGKLIQNIY